MKYQSLLILVLGFAFSIASALALNACLANRKQGLFTVLDAKIDLNNPQDRSRFARLDGRARLVFLFLTVCAGGFVYVVLQAISSLRMMLLPPAMINVVADRISLAFIGCVGGAGIAMAILVPVMRRWWPEDTKWYLAYTIKRDRGGGYERSYRVWGSAIVALALMPFPLMLNWYAQARDVGLIIHPFFSISERLFPYSDIKSIEIVALRGRYGYQDHYFMSFKDGQTLKVDSNFPVRCESEYTPLMRLLSEKSGVPIKSH
ncbi:MAG TPA: hypothetical protein VJP80_01570 [Candidatus Saccharimonadales bacterium]|nr:hypothetical protein [Candidatus Saccharimonadales bacterium]